MASSLSEKLRTRIEDQSSNNLLYSSIPKHAIHQEDDQQQQDQRCHRCTSTTVCDSSARPTEGGGGEIKKGENTQDGQLASNSKKVDATLSGPEKGQEIRIVLEHDFAVRVWLPSDGKAMKIPVEIVKPQRKPH